MQKRKLGQNHGSANVELTANDLAEIRQAAAEIPIVGEGYPAHLLATVRTLWFVKIRQASPSKE